MSLKPPPVTTLPDERTITANANKAVGIGFAGGVLLCLFPFLTGHLAPYIGLVGGLCSGSFAAMTVLTRRDARRGDVVIPSRQRRLALIAGVLVAIGVLLTLGMPVVDWLKAAPPPST